MVKKYYSRRNTHNGRTAARVNKLISQRREKVLDEKWSDGRITKTKRNKRGKENS